ncbi:MAG: fatty-acid--CoA ligase [Mycobacterium sp.]
MKDWLANSLVLVSDYRVPDTSKVWPLLQRRSEALADMGVHHVLVYASTTDPERVLVILGIHAHEPVLDLVRSRVFFDRIDYGIDSEDDNHPANHPAPPVMVSMVTSLADMAALSTRARRVGGVSRLRGSAALEFPRLRRSARGADPAADRRRTERQTLVAR